MGLTLRPDAGKQQQQLLLTNKAYCSFSVCCKCVFIQLLFFFIVLSPTLPGISLKKWVKEEEEELRRKKNLQASKQTKQKKRCEQDRAGKENNRKQMSSSSSSQAGKEEERERERKRGRVGKTSRPSKDLIGNNSKPSQVFCFRSFFKKKEVENF